MKVRRYEDSDFKEVARLYAEFDVWMRDTLPEDAYKFEAPEENGIETWIRDTAAAGNGFFVAEDSPGRLAGFIHGSVENEPGSKISRWGALDSIYVAAGYRGQGIGSDLYKALEAWFKEQGCQAAHVETWLTNARAIEAYHAMGFTPNFTGLVKEL